MPTDPRLRIGRARRRLYSDVVKCGTCNYDMSGTPDAERCPECASLDWRKAPAAWSAAEWWALVFAMCPLVWVGLVHVLLVVARGSLGRWPHRGGMDDPKCVPVVSDLRPLVGFFALAFVLTPLATLFISAMMHFYARQPWSRSGAVLVRGIGLWLAAIVLVTWDPALAVAWFLD